MQIYTRKLFQNLCKLCWCKLINLPYILHKHFAAIFGSSVWAQNIFSIILTINLNCCHYVHIITIKQLKKKIVSVSFAWNKPRPVPLKISSFSFFNCLCFLAVRCFGLFNSSDSRNSWQPCCGTSWGWRWSSRQSRGPKCRKVWSERSTASGPSPGSLDEPKSKKIDRPVSKEKLLIRVKLYSFLDQHVYGEDHVDNLDHYKSPRLKPQNTWTMAWFVAFMWLFKGKEHSPWQ